MALKVLIADIDQDWALASESYFKAQLYDVDLATSGKQTQLKLYQEKYFALIMNWSLQNHSAKQVLFFARKNYPSLKVILLVDDSSMLELEGDSVEALKKSGVSAVLVKPYEREEIRKLLEGEQGTSALLGKVPTKSGMSDEVEVQGEDSEYCPIGINDFFSGKAVLFDVFIRLRANRYIKILHSGDTFSRERIEKYRDEKGVEYLYYHVSDRKKFLQFNTLVASKMVTNDKVLSTTKISMVKNIASQYIDEVHTEGLKPQVLEQGKAICATVHSLVENDKELYKFLRDFQALDPSAYSHSFLVTLYATSITKQFDWESSQTLQSVAMACLFHDIGKLSLPAEIRGKRPIEMNDEEILLYKRHPVLGVELVGDNRQINNIVKQVILQHHEAYDGTGYPYKVKGSKIQLVANIVGLVDDFVHLMLDQESSPLETLKGMLKDKEQMKKYHSSVVENFIKVFVNPDKLEKELSKKAS